MLIVLSRHKESVTMSVQRLIAEFRAVKLSFTWFGVRKSLSDDLKDEAAERFGAESSYMSAAKKLLNTRHPAWRAVGSVKSQATGHWRMNTLPFTEPGIRLLPESGINAFHDRMTEYRSQLLERVGDLDDKYAELRRAAKGQLGRLYKDEDYPSTMVGLFDVTWEFPSVEPPDYLRELNPELYEQERQRLVNRFDESLRLAESQFVEELNKMLSHLTDRLTGNEDGTPKRFEDSTVTKISEFFERFRSLNVNSNAQLDALVTEAERLVGGVDPEFLRNSSNDIRQVIASQISAVTASLDGMMVDRPRRALIRQK